MNLISDVLATNQRKGVRIIEGKNDVKGINSKSLDEVFSMIRYVRQETARTGGLT